MKKKIGIQTLILRKNYGGLLQAFALQHVLEGMGHEVVHLNAKRNTDSIKQRFRYLISRLIRRDLYKVEDKVKARFDLFIKQNINLSKPLNNRNKWESYIKKQKFDVLIAGSDQVWRLDYNKDCIPECFLDYRLGGVKKISYSASLGVSTFDDRLKEILSKYLPSFDSLSLRENDSVRLLKQELNIDSSIAVDPTLLLDKEDYIKYFGLKENLTKSLFCYVLDDENLDFAKLKNLATDLQLDLKKINGCGVTSSNYKSKDIIEKPTIEQWLEGIYSSDLVITDSFHGVVFSIIFNKPFYVRLNKERGVSRFISLLESLDLEDRILNEDSFSYEKIDYLTVNKKLVSLKEYSYKYLYDNLK